MVRAVDARRRRAKMRRASYIAASATRYSDTPCLLLPAAAIRCHGFDITTLYFTQLDVYARAYAMPEPRLLRAYDDACRHALIVAASMPAHRCHQFIDAAGR